MMWAPLAEVQRQIEFQALCCQHRVVGIAVSEVVMGERKVPPGWRLDPETNFWVPPNLLAGNRRRH